MINSIRCLLRTRIVIYDFLAFNTKESIEIYSKRPISCGWIFSKLTHFVFHLEINIFVCQLPRIRFPIHSSSFSIIVDERKKIFSPLIVFIFQFLPQSDHVVFFHM